MAGGTPNPIAYGNVAAVLRQELDKRGWKAADLCRALGISKTAAHPWLKAIGAPGPTIRPKLAKLLNIHEELLLRRESAVEGVAPKSVGAPTYPVAVQRRVAEVLSFTVTSEGEARIKLDITLPVTHGMPLLRMLMDHGLIAQEQ